MSIIIKKFLSAKIKIFTLYFKDKWQSRRIKKIYLIKIIAEMQAKRIIIWWLIRMVKIFNFINAVKDVEECSISKFCPNTKKFVKRFFSPKGKHLILQHLDKYKLKEIFKRLLSLNQKNNWIKQKSLKKGSKRFQSGNCKVLNFEED